MKPMNIETIDRTIRNYVADVRDAMPIDHAFIFGSYAKGTATGHSDVDLCFFSHSFENQSSIEVMMKLMRLSRKYRDIDIEPHVFPTSELQKDNPFVKEILRTGTEL